MDNSGLFLNFCVFLTKNLKSLYLTKEERREKQNTFKSDKAIYNKLFSLNF